MCQAEETAKAVGHQHRGEVYKPTRREVAFMVIEIELNFKLRKLSIIIKKDRSADPGTVRATKK